MSVAVQIENAAFAQQVSAMRREFREGDLVRHHSRAVPIRVIGTGAIIAVEYPNGVMRAFEPFELEKVIRTALPLVDCR